MYNPFIKKYCQASPTFSQLETLDKPSPRSSLTPSPIIPPPPPPIYPLPPTDYTPTIYEYQFVNFGLPHYEGNRQYYNLLNEVTWIPILPATLILAMDNLHVMKVGLEPIDVKALNSIVHDMHRAMSPTHYNTEVEYFTHNSIIYIKIDDRTSVQLIRGEYVYMAPASILSQWTNSSLKATKIHVTIRGFRRCCGRLETTFHAKSIMVDDTDSYDEGYNNIMTII